MAQVAQPDIDYHLDYQFGAWEGIPEYAEWWAEMDVIDKEVFHLEWMGITESRLRELERWAAQGLLNPSQCRRYEELRRLIEQYRPVAENMLAE